MDIGMLMKAKQAWNTFTSNHPKFPAFLRAVNERGIAEGTIITIELKYPEGDTMKSNIKVQQSDLEMLDLARSVLGGGK
jgi:hypothetical protein